MSIIRADSIKNRSGLGAPDFPNGITVTGIVTSTILDSSVSTLNVTGGHVNVGSNIQLGDAGILTATTFKGNIEGTSGTFSGNVSVGGTLTYEDVTNIDSIGIVTARDGLKVLAGGANVVGVVTATSFSGDGSSLTGIDATKIITGNTQVQTIDTGSDGHIKFSTEGTARSRVDNSGHFTPEVNNTYDLGTSSLRWRVIYTNDLELSNKGSQNSVDGTWGDWTLQEGENDIFMINKRNGKKFKINMTEVS